MMQQEEIRSLRDEIERLRGLANRYYVALVAVDESIRHHLRSDAISAAMIQPHAVSAVRNALDDEQAANK